jgi:5-methylcytosine-specific restriction protein B
MEFFVELKKLGAEFGFRTALEIFQYASKISLLASNDKFWDINAIVDTAILQKLLPKIHGSRKKLDPFLKILAIKCFKENSVHDINIEEFLLNNSGNPVFLENIRFPLTLEKITRMYRRVIQDGFTSFAEA